MTGSTTDIQVFDERVSDLSCEITWIHGGVSEPLPADVSSITVTDDFGDGTGLALGRVCSRTAVIDALRLNTDIDLSGTEIVITLAARSGTSEGSSALGRFVISQVQSGDDFLSGKITAMDCIAYLGSPLKLFIEAGVEPTISELLDSILVDTGVSFDWDACPDWVKARSTESALPYTNHRLPGWLEPYLVSMGAGKYTVSEMLGFWAAKFGCNLVSSRTERKVFFRPITATEYTVPHDAVYDSGFVRTTQSPVVVGSLTSTIPMSPNAEYSDVDETGEDPEIIMPLPDGWEATESGGRRVVGSGRGLEVLSPFIYTAEELQDLHSRLFGAAHVTNFTFRIVGTLDSVQWFSRPIGSYADEWEGWAPIPGATSTTLAVANTPDKYGHEFKCEVEYEYGSDEEHVSVRDVSDAVRLISGVPTLQILQQPKSWYGNTGRAIFAVGAVGEGLTYQWQYARGDTSWTRSTASGNQTAEVDGGAVNTTRDGTMYRCIVSDKYGNSVISEPATVHYAASEVGVHLVLQPFSNTVEPSGLLVQPCALKYRGNPCVDAGDIIEVEDRSGEMKDMLITQQTIFYDGGLYGEAITGFPTDEQALQESGNGGSGSMTSPSTFSQLTQLALNELTALRARIKTLIVDDLTAIRAKIGRFLIEDDKISLLDDNDGTLASFGEKVVLGEDVSTPHYAQDYPEGFSGAAIGKTGILIENYDGSASGVAGSRFGMKDGRIEVGILSRPVNALRLTTGMQMDGLSERLKLLSPSRIELESSYIALSGELVDVTMGGLHVAGTFSNGHSISANGTIHCAGIASDGTVTTLDDGGYHPFEAIRTYGDVQWRLTVGIQHDSSAGEFGSVRLYKDGTEVNYLRIFEDHFSTKGDGWTTISSYSSANYQDPVTVIEPIQYRKVNNHVFIRGTIGLKSTWASSNTIFTLPTGYRPAENQYYMNAGTEDKMCKVRVRSTGTVGVTAMYDLSKSPASLSSLSSSVAWVDLKCDFFVD